MNKELEHFEACSQFFWTLGKYQTSALFKKKSSGVCNITFLAARKKITGFTNSFHTGIQGHVLFFDWQKVHHFESQKITKISIRGATRNEIA